VGFGDPPVRKKCTAVYYLFNFKIFFYYFGFAMPAIKVSSGSAIFASLLKSLCLLVMVNGNHLQSLFDYDFMKYDYATALATEFYSCFCDGGPPPKSSEADRVSFHLTHHVFYCCRFLLTHSNLEKGLTMSKLLLLRECKSSNDKSIRKVGGHQMACMILLTVMEFKQLVEVHIR
jgi:hypothetical protein